MCLQETNFKNSFCANLRNFSPVFKNRRNTDFASGGVAVYTKSHIHHEKVKLNTNLEAVAISTITPSKFCISNTSIPNRHEINLTSNAALSSIDLSLCSSNIAQTINWNILDDLYDSDHFPIRIEIQNPHPTMYNYTPRWKYKKADWNKFK